MENLAADRKAQITNLKTKLSTLITKIKTITEQGRAIATDHTQLFLFKGMYIELKPYFDAFNDTWDKAVELVATWNVSNVFPLPADVTLQKNAERYYYESCAIYANHMNPTPSASGGTTQNLSLNESRTVRARLPHINLPTFSGLQVEWPLFRDTYTSLIHNESSLSNIEKFLFLVSCLKGAPLALIKGIELQEANYEQAWRVLNTTYNDKRRLANSYLKNVLEFVPFKSRPSESALKHLLTTVCESVDSFKQLKVPNAEDFILFCLVLRCLDPSTRRSFEKANSGKEFPKYQDLVDFIKVEWRSLELTLENVAPSLTKQSGHQSNKQQLTPRGTGQQTSLLASNRPTGKEQPNVKMLSCPVCNNRHTLYQCAQFKRATPTERLSRLKNWAGCTNCLSSKHASNQCTSQRRCQACAQSHHTWLHTERGPGSLNHQTQAAPAQTDGVALGSQSTGGEVLLGTATVEVQDADGAFIKVRAVTDSGSQHSFMTDSCAARLGLPIKPCMRNISGIGQQPLTGLSGKLKCNIRSPLDCKATIELQAEPIVVPRITGNLPHTTVSSAIQDLYKSYVLADPDFWKPGPVELLLGADLFFDIITGRPIKVAPHAPRLLPTLFGHIVGGLSQNTSASNETSSLLVQSNGVMKDVMSKFWDLEEVSRPHIISEEDKICEAHFASTHYRLATGRYVVSLPFKESIRMLTNPYQQALSRLLTLEFKLAKNAWLKQEYCDFMKEYLALGHMKSVPPNTSTYVIPHHAVLKCQNGSNKLRVVFDASCRTRFGSLNDHMYTGPKLQMDIADVISNFRTHRFVLTADIVKMYRQISINEQDRKYQHILWRFDPSDNVQEYELCTVTYGEKPSAFLAQRTIQQLVHDEGASYPLASNALLHDIYVDDIATGAQSTSALMDLKDDLNALLEKGGFKLSKWASNCPMLLASLDNTELGGTSVTLTDETDSRVKILGIQWSPTEDTFAYEISTPPWNPTKRAILSAIARIYDPLGFIAPVVFYAKTIMQETWIAKTGWDETGPPDVCDKWLSFINQLHCLSAVQIPRCFTSSQSALFKIMGFSDASQKGYAAVLYVLAVADTACEVSLLKAKSKLAPIKPLTIPRLELSGALLLSRLYLSCQTIRERLNITEARFFTDSQIVLGWLSTPPENLKTFVAHRVVEILDSTARSQWNFVPSEENPADCCSRGILPSELLAHPLWWNGPPRLTTLATNWPEPPLDGLTNLPELKDKQSTALNVTDSSSLMDWMERFSSYPKMIRSAAYAMRFINALRQRPTPNGPISVPEYKDAEKSLLKIAQSQYKSAKDQLIDSKALRPLHPFIDEEGFIRVGGRLQRSQLPHDAKHPLLLPGDSHFCEILVDHYHRCHLHLAPVPLKAMLQNRFWIIGARGLIRRRVFNCIKCYKAMRSPQAPLMGNLPPSRLAEGLVFSHVGVDFAGPFPIRESLRRKAALGKAYLCLFICMTTKAVHLESVSSCSTEAFLAAFERFVGRRGKPNHMYSDCGTNFVGASNRLREIILWLRSKETQDQILKHATPLEIKWSFNPPSSPHFGGLWEAGVKSCKTILFKVIGESAVTFEELTTLFCRIEGILNSRPLAPLESDTENVECLTPGHFLIGRALIALPEEQHLGNISTLQRWKLIQQKAQHFWNRWRLEYLNQLQHRRKWTKVNRNLNVGDLVIIKEPNCTMKTWPLARILETHNGSDGITRVVTLKTPTGVYKRPVAKLVPLTPINMLNA